MSVSGEPTRMSSPRRGKRALRPIVWDHIAALERAKEGLRDGDIKFAEAEIDWVLETMLEKLR